MPSVRYFVHHHWRGPTGTTWTLDPFIPNEVFYQLNYCWIWCARGDSNTRQTAYGGEGKIRTCIRVFFQLNYFPKGRYSTNWVTGAYGTPCWIQTNDTWLRRPLLYSTELMGYMEGTVGNRTHPSGFGDRLASLGTFAPILAGTEGLEPSTSWLTVMRSNQLSYAPKWRPIPDLNWCPLAWQASVILFFTNGPYYTGFYGVSTR